MMEDKFFAYPFITITTNLYAKFSLYANFSYYGEMILLPSCQQNRRYPRSAAPAHKFEDAANKLNLLIMRCFYIGRARICRHIIADGMYSQKILLLFTAKKTCHLT